MSEVVDKAEARAQQVIDGIGLWARTEAVAAYLGCDEADVLAKFEGGEFLAIPDTAGAPIFVFRQFFEGQLIPGLAAVRALLADAGMTSEAQIAWLAEPSGHRDGRSLLDDLRAGNLVSVTKLARRERMLTDRYKGAADDADDAAHA